MAAGAGDVRLQLGVTLDLASFRQQLAAASRAAASFSYPINFDKASIDRQFAALDRQFKRRNYRLEVITNFAAEIENADKLISRIQQVKQAAQGTTGRGGGSPIGVVGVTQLSRTAGQRPGGIPGVSKDDIKALYESLAIAGIEGFERGANKTRPQMVAQIGALGRDTIAGLLNGLNSENAALEAAAKNLGTALIKTFKALLGIASPSRVFREFGKNVGEGFEQGLTASMDKAFDALERQLRQRLAVLQGLMSGGKGAFPFVAKTGPIEQRALFAESANLARKIDQTRAEISQIQTRRESRLSFQRESLAEVAGRLLPAARDRSLPAARATIFPRGTAADQALQEFFRSLRNAQDFLARNFSANTYLPKASRQLAASMSESSRLLRGQRIAGLLPSREMLEPLKFQRAMEAAQRIDAANAFRGTLLRPLLPSAGGTGATAAASAALSGQQFRAPSVGRTGAGQPGAAMDQSGPIADRLRQAAVNFSKNAPAVIKYLNLFSTAGGINVSDLPGAGESPGQYIRRIQESLRLQLKQGGFGAGQVPSRTEFFRPGQGAQLPGMPLQLRLPPSGGTGGGDRVRGAGQPPQRGGAIVPYAPATRLPDGYFENVRKYAAALEMARATMNKFSASQLPFVGGLRGLAVEFGEATKQVLLYGTAYKGLAFITSLPGQILNAAKGQQQYNNALQTATQDTNTFAKELLFVDNVQRTFGLSLETTRTGFTRLYASMAPTGFDSGSIEKLFTGISAATAALQLTPDKAERVIYAFGQMASKGQIMSEELKGQLGDVLPGALALFAKAAGMSVKDFSKAMEDGVFVGGKFREVFAKVSDELMTRFGTGAQAAGKSLQGLLNTVQGDFQRTLESFSPLANAAAQSILGPLGGALRQLSTSAQIAMGELGRIQSQLSAARQNVEDVRAGGGSTSQIQGAEQQVAALEVRYRALNEALKDPAVAKQVKDLQLLVQELTKAGTFVMNVASAIGNILSPVINLLGTNLTSVIATITTFYVGLQTARLAAMALMGTLMLYRGLSVLLGFAPAALQATALAGAFNVLGVAASGAQVRVVGLRLALTALVASTVIGAVVAGIVAIASAFASMSDKAKEAAQSSQDAAKSAIEAARAGNIAGAAMGVQGVLTESRKATAARRALEAIYARSSRSQRQGGPGMEITAAESIALQGSPLTSGMIQAGVSLGGVRQIRVPSKVEMSGIRGQFGSLAGQQAINLREAKEAQRQAEIVNKQLGLNKPTPSVLPPEAQEASAKASKAAQKAAERAAKEAQRLQAVERQLNEELRIRRRTLQIDENIAAARADQDDERVAELESDKRILDIGIRRAKIQKDFDAKRIKAAEYKLRLQLLEIDKTEEQQKYEEDLNKIFRERFGITDTIARAAREAREKSFGMGIGAGAFRTDIDLMPGLTNGVLGERQEEIKQELAALLKPANQLVEAANNIGKAFGESFKGMISGSMTAQQALAGFFQSIGDYFLDMASRMIAKWIEMQIIGLAKSLLPGGNTVFPGGAPDFSNAFGPGGPVFQLSAFAANGAVWQGGFTPFANGGIVTGPTLGLVGEGRFNEAVVPLPNGKSIPVDLGDGAGNNISTNIVINVGNGQAQSSMTGGGASDLGRKMEGAVKQVIVNELRPGGLLSGGRR